MECGITACQKDVSRLYAPEHFTHKMTKENFLTLNKKTICFDWVYNDLKFIEGSVSCTGVEIIFKNDWFRKILVYPMYDYKTGNIYNRVLAIPDYTKKDREGKKKICQSSHIIRSQKDLHRYFKKMFDKFECPVIS